MRRFNALPRRTASVCAVIAIHALIGRLFYGAFIPHAHAPLPEASEAVEVRLINVPPPVVQRAAAPAASPPPSQAADPGSPSAFIAAGASRAANVPASAAPAIPLIDAGYFDPRALSAACARAYPDTAPDLDIEGTVILMVKVEPTGRPSELKVVRSSGAASLDEAVGACVMSLGSFPPASVNGRAVASWRQLTWTVAH
jgi:protein TonB